MESEVKDEIPCDGISVIEAKWMGGDEGISSVAKKSKKRRGVSTATSLSTLHKRMSEDEGTKSRANKIEETP